MILSGFLNLTFSWSLILNYLIFYTYHCQIINQGKIKFIKVGENLRIHFYFDLVNYLIFEFYSF